MHEAGHCWAADSSRPVAATGTTRSGIAAASTLSMRMKTSLRPGAIAVSKAKPRPGRRPRPGPRSSPPRQCTAGASSGSTQASARSAQASRCTGGSCALPRRRCAGCSAATSAVDGCRGSGCRHRWGGNRRRPGAPWPGRASAARRVFPTASAPVGRSGRSGRWHARRPPSAMGRPVGRAQRAHRRCAARSPAGARRRRRPAGSRRAPKPTLELCRIVCACGSPSATAAAAPLAACRLHEF